MTQHTKSKSQQGFTVVELMVTLLVASLFIVSGYQLYATVSLRVSKIRQMSEASNIGYDVLRNEASDYIYVATPCSGTPSQTSVSRTAPATLKNMSIHIQRCRPFSDSNIVRSTVVVQYGESTSSLDRVEHATYTSD